MKRTAPLAIVLVLVLGAALATALRAPHDTQTTLPAATESQLAVERAGSPAASPKAAAVEVDAPAATETTAPQPSEGSAGQDGLAGQAEQPKIKTGCGKAVPCPNRSCENCPFNIYLK
jgi:hypothetical protein